MEITIPRSLERGTISDVVKRAVDEMLAEIPPHERYRVSANVTLRGVELEAATRLARGLEGGVWFAQTTDGQREAGLRLVFRR